MSLCVTLLQIHIPRLEDEFPTLRHGVARVHHQVYDDLLDLAAVRFCAAQCRTPQNGQINVLAD